MTNTDGEATFELLQRVRSGDRAALERLVQRYLRPLRQWARGRLPYGVRDLADTEDLVQDVLIQTLQRLDTFEPRREGALQAYLRQAVMNRIRDEFRRAKRRPRGPEPDEAAPDLEGPSPLEAAIGGEMLDRYEAALASLKDTDREAIIARIELGYSYEAVAEALDKPSPDAARVAVNRALLRLAQQMNHGT